MTRVYVGLGSNLGNKVGNIRKAVAGLGRHADVGAVRVSSFYRTAPVGKLDQDWFVNAVVELETRLSASALLELCLAIEREMKRVRGERWGPRTLDLDILYFGEEVIESEALTVPHPRALERAFVLRPLLELNPDLEWKGERLDDSLAALSEQAIEKMDTVVAVVGASAKPDRYANMAQRFLAEAGFRVLPVAPKAGEVLGVPVVESLIDCTDPVDTVTLYIGSNRVESVLEDLLEVLPRRVIFNPGTENALVRERLEAAGVETLEACTLVMLRTGQF